jgi:hypothetical protein
MKHLPLHDVGRVAANPDRDTKRLLIQRLSPGGSFMTYRPVEEIARHLLEGSCTHTEARRWIDARRDKKYVRNNYLEILDLIAAWSKGRSGHFVPLKNRKLPFTSSDATQVNISGLWIHQGGPMLVWFFMRKAEALLGKLEYGFVVGGIRQVFTERELRNIPISCVDLSADESSNQRVLNEYRDTELRVWNDSEMDVVFQRYLDARLAVEPLLAQKRLDQKAQKKASEQGDLFESWPNND